MNEPTGKKVGSVTKVAATSGAAGAGLGYAITDILVHFIPSADPISGQLGLVVTVILGLLAGLVGGKLTPTDQGGDGFAAKVAAEELQMQLARLSSLDSVAPADEPAAEVAEYAGPTVSEVDDTDVWSRMEQAHQPK